VSTHDIQLSRARDENSTKLLRFAEGQSVYTEGEPVRCWYEVRSGVVRTCRHFANGDRHLVSFLFPGDVFGIERIYRTETAEAIADVEVVRHDHVGVGLPLNGEAMLEAALANMRSCVYLLAHRTAEQRVAAFLLALSERIETEVEIPVPMSRTDIADHLRLTIHTVSRVFSRLVRNRVIRLNGPQSFTVRDRPTLRSLAGEEGAREMPDQ